MQRLLDMGGQSGEGLLALILHGMQAKERLHMARCCHFLHQLVSKPAAWKHCTDLVTAYVGPNTSACTRHMPVCSTAPLSTADSNIRHMLVTNTFLVSTTSVNPSWMLEFQAFASSVCLRSVSFDSSRVAVYPVVLLASLFAHHAFIHLERLTVRTCEASLGAILSGMPRLHTLTVDTAQLPIDAQSLCLCPSLTSLAFIESKWHGNRLSIVGTFPHLQRLQVTGPRVADVLLFCQTIAHNHRFTDLTVHEMITEYHKDLPDVVDFGPLASVTIRGASAASDAFLRALAAASSLRQIVLVDFCPFAIIQMLLHSNVHLCVFIRSTLRASDVPSDDETVLLEHLRRSFPNRFTMA